MSLALQSSESPHAIAYVSPTDSVIAGSCHQDFTLRGRRLRIIITRLGNGHSRAHERTKLGDRTAGALQSNFSRAIRNG